MSDTEADGSSSGVATGGADGSTTARVSVGKGAPQATRSSREPKMRRPRTRRLKATGAYRQVTLRLPVQAMKHASQGRAVILILDPWARSPEPATSRPAATAPRACRTGGARSPQGPLPPGALSPTPPGPP